MESLVFGLIYAMISFGPCSYPSLFLYKWLYRSKDGGVYYLASTMIYIPLSSFLSLVFSYLRHENIALERNLAFSLMYFFIVPFLVQKYWNSLEDLPGKRRLYLRWCSVSSSLLALLILLIYFLRSGSTINQF